MYITYYVYLYQAFWQDPWKKEIHNSTATPVEKKGDTRPKQ